MTKEDRYAGERRRAAAASRPINLFRTATGPRAPAVLDRLDAVQSEIEALENRRARDSASGNRFRHCLRALCLDLFAAYVLDPKMEIGVSRDSSALSANPAHPPFVSARPFVDALNGLISSGYVEQLSLGNEGSGQSTRVRATPKLIGQLTIADFSVRDMLLTHDLIQLKLGRRGKPKKRVKFEDTPDTVRWRNNLSLINSNNARYHIALDLSPSDRRAMEAQRWAKAVIKAKRYRAYEYERLDESRTRLHRVFNKRDWSEGGRFYGGWWQAVPSAYRKHITINGKQTREYDYSAAQLRILYADMGCDLSLQGDPYSRPYGEGYREVVKRCFNVMLNVKGRPDQSTVPDFSASRMRMSWNEFVDGVIEHHRPIASAFGSGIGGRLQRRDADIAEQVMLKFLEMQQPCLPVHDSFITYASLADELPDIMAAAAEAVVGRPLPSKQGEAVEYAGPTGPVSDDMPAILDEMRKAGIAQG
jgi:hypothetical protein